MMDVAQAMLRLAVSIALLLYRGISLTIVDLLLLLDVRYADVVIAKGKVQVKSTGIGTDTSSRTYKYEYGNRYRYKYKSKYM